MSRWRWRRRVTWPSALVMLEAAGFSVVTAAFLALGRVYSLPPIVAFDTARTTPGERAAIATAWTCWPSA